MGFNKKIDVLCFRYWRLSGRPTVCLLIREEHMRDPQFKEMLDLLAMLKKGYCDGMKVRIGRLQNLISSSCVEHLDFMNAISDTTVNEISFTSFKQLEHDYIGYQSLTDVPRALHFSRENKNFYDEFRNKSNEEIIDTIKNIESIYGRCQLFGILLRRLGPAHKVFEERIDRHLQCLYHQAGGMR